MDDRWRDAFLNEQARSLGDRPIGHGGFAFNLAFDTVATAGLGAIWSTGEALVARTGTAMLNRSLIAEEIGTVAHPLAGISAREVIDMTASKGLQTQRDSLILWSGLGRDGPVRAQAFAREFGGTTLEMTPRLRTR